MKQRRVLIAPEAAADINEIYDWVAKAASPQVAIGYIGRIETFCRELGTGGERGHLRADVRPGLRIMGFERRLTVAFVVGEETVTVLRVFATGQNWESSF